MRRSLTRLNSARKNTRFTCFANTYGNFLLIFEPLTNRQSALPTFSLGEKEIYGKKSTTSVIFTKTAVMSLKALKPVFHLANLFARTEKKVGTVPTCSRRIFSPTNFNQSRCRILVFASRRANKFAKWKTGLKMEYYCENRKFIV